MQFFLTDRVIQVEGLDLHRRGAQTGILRFTMEIVVYNLLLLVITHRINN